MIVLHIFVKGGQFKINHRNGLFVFYFSKFGQSLITLTTNMHDSYYSCIYKFIIL